MTVNPWNSINLNFDVNEDSFNAPVSGGSFLDLGLHKHVYIEGIEAATARNGNPFLKLVWSSDDKQTMRDNVFLVSRPDDNGVVGPHFTLKRLMSALIPDKQLRTEFMAAVKGDPALFASLVGLRADIEVGLGRDGYTIKEAAGGGVYLFDVETKEKINDTIYEGYREAREAAEELGLQRCWPEVKKILVASQDGGQGNCDAVQTTLSAAANPTSGKVAVNAIPMGSPRRM